MHTFIALLQFLSKIKVLLGWKSVSLKKIFPFQKYHVSLGVQQHFSEEKSVPQPNKD